MVSELKDNLSYLDMVAEDDVPLGDVIRKISFSEYKRFEKADYNFATLKRGKITRYASLAGTELSSWAGKSTGELVESIYDKINELKIRYPHVSKKKITGGKLELTTFERESGCCSSMFAASRLHGGGFNVVK